MVINLNYDSAHLNLKSTFVCLINARNLFNKMLPFLSFVYSSEFNIYCICETWLPDFVYDREILPVNFTIYHKDRPSRGGNFRSCITVSNVFDSLHLSSPALEIVTIQFGCCHDVVLCTSYVPPNSSDTYLLALLN